MSTGSRTVPVMWNAYVPGWLGTMSALYIPGSRA